MASSSATPVGLPLQPNAGEGLEAPPAVPAASTKAMVDAPTTPPPVPGKSIAAAPSSVSGEVEELRERFAFPLVDPWYASSPLFPPRSVDFSFPVEDWDWTVSGLEPTVDQAWVPNLDEISELLIQKGDLQAIPINFDFLCAASKDWSHWVDREILDFDFWDSLVDAGVHWSILIFRSCNMFRDTESLRELLRRWCPSTHTFFFSWGELTPTLEDVANHWMLPILGEHSLSNIQLSAAEEETAAVLKKQSSTRLSGWPSFFVHNKDAPVRRAAFVLYWLCLKTRDYDLVDALDHEENLLFRPYGDDYPGFTCALIFRKFYQSLPLIRDLKVDDYRSLSYLSTVNPGFLPILSATEGIPIGPQETATCVADLSVFLKSRAFARWGGETTRVLILGGHRLGFNTPSMGAYWQRFTQSMVEFVIAGRSDKTPISLGSRNGIVSEEAGLPIPYICQKAGRILLLWWRTQASSS
uniref:Aminotransferase-like plant mobile domain-containing protein n=1 Tax=Fagus sylvatica TaxID=28930 RepID=A0A2N9IRR4_FAGSY